MAVLYASFGDSRAQARDKVRQSSLKEVQLALELYKGQYGVYPDPGCSASSWVTPGPSTSFTSCTNYIQGLAPDFIKELPTDPNQENVSNRGFLYRTNAARDAYKVLVYQTVETITVLNYNTEFARCPGPVGSACPAGGPPLTTYAVYSPGAEAW